MGNRKEIITAPFEREKEYMEFRIAEGIERNRKDFASIRVTDASGAPIAGAAVKVNQVSHEFKFGANLYLLDEMESEEKNQKYREIFPQVFNHATLPFYWNGLEPEQGKPRFEKGSSRVYRRPTPDLCVEYCKEKGIRPKAHCLVYDCWAPDWLSEDVQESKKAYRKRMEELAQRYQNDIPEWEVINETLIPYGDRNHPMFMEPDYLEWSFRTARDCFPNNRILLNEATEWVWGRSFVFNRSNYYLLIERLLRENVDFDGIGMQFHMFIRQKDEAAMTPWYYDPRRLYQVLDRYEDFHKPIEITEITIPAYSEMPEDEQTQAEIVRNLYRMWFSHGTVESIVWWNLVDGYAYVRPGAGADGWNENVYYGGLLRHDLSPKPAFEVMRSLIRDEWHTRESLTTCAQGKAKFRGFFGEYEVTVTLPDGKTVTSRISLNKGAGHKREFAIVI